MKTEKEFDDYYQQNIRVHGQGLNDARNRVLMWLFITGPAFFVCLSVIFYLTIKWGFAGDVDDFGKRVLIMTLVLSLMICAVVVYGFFIYDKYKRYNRYFKEVVIRNLLNFIQTDLNYAPNAESEGNWLLLRELYAAGNKNYNYNGHDLVKGKSGRTGFSFSAFKMRETTGEGQISYRLAFPFIMGFCMLIIAAILVTISGPDHSYQPLTLLSLGAALFFFLLGFVARRSSVLFQGIFFTADFNKNFKGWTFVIWKKGKWGLNNIVKRGEVVNLENIEFANDFLVYSNDQVEARYILSPGLMERIIHLKQKANSEISIAFANSSIFIAMPMEEDIFQAKLFSAALDKTTVERYFHYVQLTIGIVDEMDLNTRIWTKA